MATMSRSEALSILFNSTASMLGMSYWKVNTCDSPDCDLCTKDGELIRRLTANMERITELMRDASEAGDDSSLANIPVSEGDFLDMDDTLTFAAGNAIPEVDPHRIQDGVFNRNAA